MRSGSGPAPWLVATVLLLLIGCSGRRSVPPALDYTLYRGVAVLPFQTEGFLEQYGAEIADQIIIEILSREPGFPIVERAKVDEVLKERTLQETQLGAGLKSHLVPADLILTGSVNFEVESVVRPSVGREAWLTATVRAFEPASGRIVWAGRFRGVGIDVFGYEAEGTVYRLQTDAEIRERAIRELAEEIVIGMMGTIEP